MRENNWRRGLQIPKLAMNIEWESTKAFARKRLSHFSASDNGIGIFRKQLTIKSANFSPRRTLRIGLN